MSLTTEEHLAWVEELRDAWPEPLDPAIAYSETPPNLHFDLVDHGKCAMCLQTGPMLALRGTSYAWTALGDSRCPDHVSGRPIWQMNEPLRLDLTICRKCLLVGVQTGIQEERDRPGRVQRYLVMRRDGFRCQICGRTAQDEVRLVVDHKHPVAHGGTNEQSNMWTLCDDCNYGKGTRPLMEPQS